MAKVEINLRAGMGSILVDGVPVKGVRHLEIISHPGQASIVKLEVYAEPLEFVEADASIETTKVVPK
jgi:hypothetical protein